MIAKFKLIAIVSFFNVNKKIQIRSKYYQHKLIRYDIKICTKIAQIETLLLS